MSDNLRIYNNVKQPPETALRTIQAGRLKGKSDINPMWRIKALTEEFGPCGVGWKYEITEKRLEHTPGGEVAAFVDINLYVMLDGEWSDPIPGTGGNMFVIKEQKGMHTSDECFKMALTDALSVACKALGMAADVYWSNDRTKYTNGATPPSDTPKEQPSKQPPKEESQQGMINQGQIKAVWAQAGKLGFEDKEQEVRDIIMAKYQKESVKELTYEQGRELINYLNSFKEGVSA